MNNVHPFEQALLGKAPFRCVRIQEIVHNGRAGSSCDYCGTSIRWAFFIVSTDGKEFKVGCDCVAKTHDSGLKAEVAKIKREYKAESKRQAFRNQAVARCQDFLAKHPGLEAALKIDHEIIKDIDRKFRQYGSLSARQVHFVFSLAERAEIAALSVHTCERPPAVNVPSIDGRIQLTAKILSTRVDDTIYGAALKALYEIRTPEGVWKAWGTLPAGLGGNGDVRGTIVKIKTRVVPSKDDPTFAFFNRPSVVRA